MTLPRHPFRFNVGFLLNQPVGTNRDIHFDFDRIVFSPELEVFHLRGVTRVSRTPQGILVQSIFNGDIQTQCGRCLVDILQPLHTEFSELYAFNNRSITESELILPENGNIDQEELLREYLMIEVPMSPVCKPDCKGLCPVCGEDLNQNLCEHYLSSIKS